MSRRREIPVPERAGDRDAVAGLPSLVYGLLNSLIAPRPIAWVSTVDDQGVANLAPHSYVSVASVDPPVVMFTSVGRKDSLRNIEATGEFVVHTAPWSLREKVNATSVNAPPEVDEFALAGVTAEASAEVGPPRVAQSPALLECRLLEVRSWGEGPLAGHVVFGQVVRVAVDEDVLGDDGLPDPALLGNAARADRMHWTAPGRTESIERPRWTASPAPNEASTSEASTSGVTNADAGEGRGRRTDPARLDSDPRWPAPVPGRPPAGGWPTSAAVAARLAAHPRREVPLDGRRWAAVVLAVVEGGDGDPPAVWLTRRTSRLRAHPGQFALPGGRLDPGESVVEAGLRELHEELGVAPEAVELLGLLDDYPTRSGYVITPLVVRVAAGVSATPNPDEVAVLYEVTYPELDVDPRFVTIPESDRPVIQLPVVEHLVHAPTAAVLHQFREVALHGRATRVDDYDQPVFAWR